MKTTKSRTKSLSPGIKRLKANTPTCRVFYLFIILTPLPPFKGGVELNFDVKLVANVHGNWFPVDMHAPF
jgi:hypothetical protein